MRTIACAKALIHTDLAKIALVLQWITLHAQGFSQRSVDPPEYGRSAPGFHLTVITPHRLSSDVRPHGRRPLRGEGQRRLDFRCADENNPSIRAGRRYRAS
jgi:hypothetical protein